MKKIMFSFLLLCTANSLLLISCKEEPPEAEDPRFVVTDYADANNWLVNPGNHATKEVDVFYLYPTVYSGSENSCAVTDAGMREGAAKNRNSHASVYEETANLFMPFYRQMNATYVLTLSQEEQEKEMQKIPAVDGLAAFQYYMQHYNNGRPFLLAGHSQGSNTLLYIMEYLKDQPEMMEKFIAAYVIGFSVTPDYIAHNAPLKFAESRTDQKVIISWNTESPGITEANPVVMQGALAINPITWTTDVTHAAAELSLGSRLEENGQFVKKEHFADAQVNPERNVIICTTVDPEDYSIPMAIFPLGVLHGCDYSFYYYDLQQNVADRVAAYFGR